MTVLEIASLLDRLSVLHEELLALGEEKKRALIGNEVDALTRIVNQENKLMKEVAELDRLRIGSVRSFLHEQGIRADRETTVSDLLKLVYKPEEKRRLTEARERLMEITTKLKRQNDLNRQLTEQSLAYIHYSLDLLIGPEEAPVYRHPRQETHRAARNGFFDTRA